MAFNFGTATGGVSAPSGWNNNVVNAFGVNFGNGGYTMGNIYTGDINNSQTSSATGG
jgi:hypothetical protein